MEVVEVKLLSHTPNPDAVVYYATKLTYTPDEPLEMWDEIMIHKDEPKYQKRMRKLIHTVLKRGHHSVLEHVSFTFIVSGCSRVCTHQLVRHRIASYSQRSHRYTEIEANAFQVPTSIASSKETMDIYREHIDRSVELYYKLIAMGIPKEDARFIIPQAVTSPIMVTMNARELIHFFGLRLCTHAQWEIRHAAALMLSEVKRVAPIIFDGVGPRCVMLGFCPEGDEDCYINIVLQQRSRRGENSDS